MVTLMQPINRFLSVNKPKEMTTHLLYLQKLYLCYIIMSFITSYSSVHLTPIENLDV